MAEASSFVLPGIETEVSLLAGYDGLCYDDDGFPPRITHNLCPESLSAEAIIDSGPLGHRDYPLAFTA